jgi:hypothetical protein
MKIEVPESLIAYIQTLKSCIPSYLTGGGVKNDITDKLVLQGLYGVYEVVGKPDIDYTVVVREECEEKIIVKHEIREYKND